MKSLSALALTCCLIVTSACTPKPKAVGKRLYNDNCTACHGQTARGDGTLAEGLSTPAPDLTLIAQRNGGTFPMVDVLSKIDGYTRSPVGNTVMPEFGAELQAGPLVFLDTRDGVKTPTPSRLVALAEYLRSIQR